MTDCQFSALSFFHQRISVYRSANIIRQELVQYLSENPNNSEGQPLEYFAGLPWSRYLHNMAQSGTYGDHITLQAASNLYNIKIEIASSLGHHIHTVIQPQEYEPITRFCLGHFAEGDGHHYVALGRYFVASSVSECDGGKETKSHFNNDDTDDMLNDDDAVDVDDQFSYDDAIYAGSLFNNNDTVNNNNTVYGSDMLNNDDTVDGCDMFNNDDGIDGSDMFNNDDAVGTSDLFSNDDAVDLSVEVDEQPRELPYEIWEQILSHVISQSDFLWPDHKCRLSCKIRSVNRQFYQIMESIKLTLPHVYISDERV